MRRWLPLIILAAAQFVMVLDSSVMNVSISQIVADLDTTVTGVQLAITAYTLVMAAFMLVGAKLGDIWGRDRAFAIGLAVYGLGSLTTALSPNLAVLLFGWSLIEGLGAVLVVPAIAALIAANYEGKERALAYGIIGGVAGAAIAVGPVIGGWVTTDFSWRYVFVGEVVIVIAILLLRKRMQPAPRPEHPPKLDYGGAALSAAGLGLDRLRDPAEQRVGLISAARRADDRRHEITPFGFSLVPFLIVGGVLLLWSFGDVGGAPRAARPGHAARPLAAQDHVPPRRAGDADDAAARPAGHVLRAAGLPAGRARPRRVRDRQAAAADVGRRCSRGAPGPKLVGQLRPASGSCRSGSLALVIAALVLVGTIDVELNETGFALSLALFGIGAGLLLSQLGNVIMSSAPPDKTNEAGGLQGTAQNLGASLGTALIGSVLLAGLLTGFNDRIAANPRSRSRRRRRSPRRPRTGSRS